MKIIQADFFNIVLHHFVLTGKKIIGIDSNYKALIKGNNLIEPEKPPVYLKTTSSYAVEGQNIKIPPRGHLRQDVSLGVIIGGFDQIILGKKMKNIPEDKAVEFIGGYCLTLDMTDINLMKSCLETGLTCALAKSFDTSCPVSRFISKKELPDPANVRIWAKVNGEMKQDSSTSDMFFSIPTVISFISKYMTLEPSDLILTGSPQGGVPVKPGDLIECGLGNILTMRFPVKSA